MSRPRLRTIVLAVSLAILAGCALVVGGVTVALRSPALLTTLAGRLGYEVTARELALSPTLSGSISGLRVKPFTTDGLTLLCDTVTAQNSLDLLLHGEIDSLVLQNLRLAFHVGKDSKEGVYDLSLLAKLPNVRRLEIQNAEVLLTYAGSPRRISLTEGQLSLTNFSPAQGGRLAFRARFALTAGRDPAVTAGGTVSGSFQVTGLIPRPSGSGTLTLAVDSGAVTTGRQTLPLKGLTLAAELGYDGKTDSLAITALRGESAEFGAIQGAARAELKGETPWSANLSAASIDFPRVFEAIKPLLPQEYRAWTIQGKGAVQTELAGTYASARPSLTGTVTFSFSQGAFNSPDNTKAAQGVSGRIILRLKYAAPDQKLAFAIRAEQQGGEYLWGEFYDSLAGQAASLAAEGSYAWGQDGQLTLAGSLDLFQTGEYLFRSAGTRDDWTLRLRIAHVSHAAIVDKFLHEYLKGLSPRLATLSATGTSSLEAALRHQGAITSIAGTFRMVGATLSAPEFQLFVQEMTADLPFDLVYPPSARRLPAAGTPGLIHLRAFRQGGFMVDSLRIPLRIAQNRLEVPEPIVVPFFGGAIRLHGLLIEDVLAPSRQQFGVKVENVDLGRLTQRLLGREFPGTVNADLGVMSYRDGRIASDGKAVIGVFGGEIEATDFFAEQLASASRRFGGDFTFRNISLEEVTQRIAIGKITGVIQGSLKNAVMEYGQPAGFTLEVESVPVRGVDQRISLDAIQSISILGTGASSALNVWITRLFKEYPYSKIGLRCVLRNDKFSIVGTIHEGGKEYLVRRGLLRGVDVVNQNPENVISFKDMQERIERISRPPQPEGIRVQ